MAKFRIHTKDRTLTAKEMPEVKADGFSINERGDVLFFDGSLHDLAHITTVGAFAAGVWNRVEEVGL